MSQRFLQQWLEIVCQHIPEARAAFIVLPDSAHTKASPLAKWPVKLKDMAELIEIVKLTQQKSNQQIYIPDFETADQDRLDVLVLPISVQTKLIGILVLKVLQLTEDRRKIIFDVLQKEQKWLEFDQFNEPYADDFFTAVVAILATCYEQKSYQETLIRLVTVLTRTLDCDKVAVGEFQKHHTKVIALSNNAHFDNRTNFIQKLADAMDEAIEQDSFVKFPNSKTATIQREHQELAQKFGSGSILTIPIFADGSIFGAVTLLRGEEKPFDEKTIRFCEQTFALLTPFLALKKTDEEPLIAKLLLSFKKHIKFLFGVEKLKLKLFLTGIAGVLVLASLLQGDFNITADAILEGKTQRVIAAPVSGYLISASARAGDAVRKGEIMASLDDSELKLELSKLGGQLQKYRREYREALSTSDLVKVRVISAQIEQATAEMELTKKQIQQIALTAPYDGIVIEGDLSQQLGSPIERGDTLFKISPLEGYRIILKVNERSISYVKPGQIGSLVLSSIPGSKVNLTVQKITAVAKADNGQNIFRVEANLDNPPPLLRPGMEGIGKIKVGQASLLWIWTHEMIDWFRLWIWSWWL